VLGADVSEPSVARVRERIVTAGLRHAEAIVADASVHPFAPDSFELAFSRFGIMFFSDPVAAFENVRRAMKPGGRLALAVFRAASETAPTFAQNPLSIDPADDEPLPVHSFHTLLGDLATLTRNVVRLGRDHLTAILATPTRTQHRALDLLGLTPTA